MARPLAGTVNRPFGRLGPLAVTAAVLAALASGFATAAAQTANDPGVYKGRKIADVMSFRGAGWLERASRIEEENPDALMAALPIEEGMLVVDIGCGSGYYARRMAAVVGPEGSVLCNDIQPQMLRIAEELARREGVTNMSTVLGTEDDPRLPEGEVDLMLLVDVYHEFSEPEAMLETMREALSPDGVIALAEFRLEGRTAAHIKLDHRMSIEQVMKEWLPAGYELVERIDSLPTQHLFLFRAAR
ncbi:MAG: class I SAM-dependent methyltransferase [Acidobacteria bacterium]|nr:class I SAM-dependent methyltransferase [Acidobacteriota bacterium]